MPYEEVVASVSGTDMQPDAIPDAGLNDIVTLACSLCRTPAGMIMLVSERGGWYRASGTLRAAERPVSQAFCDATIADTDKSVVIEDAIRDPRFSDDPAVLAKPSLRFFAGIGFRNLDGSPAGILCVTDQVPRVLTAEQEHSLELLGRQLQHQLTLVSQKRQLDDLKEERQNSAAHLRASEELFRTFMNASPFLSYIKDAAGRLLFYNRSFARRFGISEHTWLGRSDEQLWSQTNSAVSRLDDLEVLHGGKAIEREEVLRSHDGRTVAWRTYKFPCYDSSGNLLLAGLAVDITDEIEQKHRLERYQEEMQQVNEQLRRLSVTDELTGLRNRRAFEERLLLEFSLSRRRRRDLAVLLIDVDDFKRINDRWGHDAGDVVLRRLGAILRTTVRLPDLVARYGGEEFIVLLPESNAEAGLGFSRRLMERMASETWDHEPVTISVGLAALNDSLLNAFQLVSMADQALYAAKKGGKKRVVTYGSAEMKL